MKYIAILFIAMSVHADEPLSEGSIRAMPPAERRVSLQALVKDTRPLVPVSLASEFLTDSDPLVRAEALNTMRELKAGRQYFPEFSRLLGDPDPRVRLAAIYAVGSLRMDGERAIPTLVELARKPVTIQNPESHDWDLIIHVETVLSMIGTPQALEERDKLRSEFDRRRQDLLDRDHARHTQVLKTNESETVLTQNVWKLTLWLLAGGIVISLIVLLR